MTRLIPVLKILYRKTLQYMINKYIDIDSVDRYIIDEM